MRKNGFTLIELLAVIVILAIIALIATPIILGIINDAREESNERSAELYLNGVELAIARRNLIETFNPSTCTITDGVVMCEGYTEPLTVEVEGETPKSGTILLEENKVTIGTVLIFNEFNIIINTEGKIEIAPKDEKVEMIEPGKMSICKPLNVQINGVYTAGDKYECDVDPNKEGYDYIFYVLNSTATEVNLIMDSNITSTGAAIKDANPTDTGLVKWYADASDNSYGPITAMNHLQTATSGWTNTNELTINKFTVCDVSGVCTDKSMKEYVVNARMPYYSEVSNVSKTTLYLIDYLNGAADSHLSIVGRNSVSGVAGYWTLSSLSTNSSSAWDVMSAGMSGGGAVAANPVVGVRPVINLSI